MEVYLASDKVPAKSKSSSSIDLKYVVDSTDESSDGSESPPMQKFNRTDGRQRTIEEQLRIRKLTIRFMTVLLSFNRACRKKRYELEGKRFFLTYLEKRVERI